MPPISLMVVAAVCLLAGVVVVGGETDGPVGEKIIPMSISMGGGGSPMAAGNPGTNGGLGPGPNDVAPPLDPFPMASRCITTGESFFLISLLCLSPSLALPITRVRIPVQLECRVLHVCLRRLRSFASVLHPSGIHL